MLIFPLDPVVRYTATKLTISELQKERRKQSKVRSMVMDDGSEERYTKTHDGIREVRL